MAWTVETLNQAVDAELGRLPKDMQARFLRIAELIEAVGLDRVGAPHVKHLDGKIWEMRMTGRDGIGRALYIAAKNRRVVVLHAFAKKTQKTPNRALDLARQRAGDVK